MLEHISGPLDAYLKKKKFFSILKLNLLVKKILGSQCEVVDLKRGVLKIKAPQEKIANLVLRQDLFINEIRDQFQEKRIDKIVFIEKI
jgi:hypothetical protein